MVQYDALEAKERILRASSTLFSRKGFDATRVSEIAREAGVTKPLIYYYFRSKAAILDELVRSLMDDISRLSMDFMHANIVEAISQGKLIIQPDRLHFTDSSEMQHFAKKSRDYFEKVLDYTLENREILRILMLESLKSGEHTQKLFQFMDITNAAEGDSIFDVISAADSDFQYSDEMILFKFFFSVIPVVSFAAYYDEYKKITKQRGEDLRRAFLHSFQMMLDSLIFGSDIFMKNVAPGGVR